MAVEGEVHATGLGGTRDPATGLREKRPILHAATSSGPPPGGRTCYLRSRPAAATTTTNYKFRMKT